MQFREMFGAAEWITHPDTQAASLLFRIPFVSAAPISAFLTIAGLGVSEAYINGRAVSADRYMPLNTDYAPRDFLIKGTPFGEVTAHRLCCPVYDVTPLITAGANTLAVITAPGWFQMSPGTLYSFGCMRLCCTLTLTYADGTVRRVVSGTNARVRTGFISESYIRTGESHDYRDYDDAWMLPAYDDSTWKTPAILAPLETDYLTSDCPADRVIRTLHPTLVWEKDGARMYDCGENITGTPVLTARGDSGEEIRVTVGERLNDDGELHEKHSHKQHFCIICGGKPRTVRMHATWLGFRYLKIEGPADLHEIQVIHSDVEVSSAFRSDSDVLNWFYAAYIRTQLGNMHMGIPSDCPHIERCGYTGDGQLTADAVMTLFGAQEFYKKWIGDISDCQDRLTGHVQYTAPYVRCGGGPGGWGCAIVEVPYLYWKHYGDTEVLARLYPQMLRYFDYLDAHSENDLVTSDRPGEWCLGDWCTPEKIRIPEPYVNTYFYIKSLDRVIEIAPIVGREAEIPALRTKRNLLAARLTEQYFDAACGDFCKNDQGANAFAVDIGLGDSRTYANITDHYRETKCFDTGIFGTDIVLRLLFTHGDAALAAELLCGRTPNGSYGHMMELGCTTLLEYWGDYARSDNHPMFGAPVRYLHQYILGIRQAADGCGWRRVVISPAIVPQLSEAEGHITTCRGKIAVSWQKTVTGVRVNVSVPAGIDAVFCLDGSTRPLGVGETTLFYPAK